MKKISNAIIIDKSKIIRTILLAVFGVGIVVVVAILLSGNSEKQFDKEGTIDGINYYISDQSDDCHPRRQKVNLIYIKRGYYIYNNTYYIMLGQKSTGDYKLKVESIKKKNNKVVIIVREIAPKEVAPTWLTCPNLSITFDQDPGEVIIKDTVGTKFDKLG